MLRENLDIKVVDNFDVAVCGGGFAGISAALASARQGKKTVLFEREYMLGGLATAGLVTWYLPLCDGMGTQVSFGIAEELLKLSISLGAEKGYPKNWLDGIGGKTEKDGRYTVGYNAQVFAILAEKLLLETGVEIMYGTYVVSVSKKDDKIDYLITENKSGREAYRVGSVVDATGDLDIGKFVNAPCETFKQGNLLASWYYYLKDNDYGLKTLGFCDIPDEEKTEENKVETLSNRRFTGLDGRENSQMVIMSHDQILKDFVKEKEGHERYWPVTIATIPQIRMTRKIKGEYELSNKEMHTYFEDSIGMISDWRKRGPVYEVPFRTLYSKEVKNLIVAGRCTSVTEPMWDIMRVIPCCAVTGEAAGLAAALTDDFTTLNVKILQEKLKENNVKIHEKDI